MKITLNKLFENSQIGG